MSLFRARKLVTSHKESLARAKENFEGRMEGGALPASSPSEASAVSSSHIGGLLDKITGPLSSDGGAATTSEIRHELSQLDREDQERAFHGTQEYERLKAQEEKEDFEKGQRMARIEDDLRRREESQVTSRVESGQLPSNLSDMRAYSDLTGITGVTGITRYGSDVSSKLSSPLPSTQYGGSVLPFPPSAISQNPFSTPSVTGVF